MALDDEANASDDMSDQDFLDVEDAEDYNRRYGNLNKHPLTGKFIGMIYLINRRRT